MRSAGPSLHSSILTKNNMDFRAATFYFFAAIMVFAALRVITSRNPVHSALFLVLSFFTAAGLWLLLEAEFLAIALVLVYVGAVMVLFLFVVMMLDINLDRLREGYWDYLVPALIVAGVMVAEMALVLGGRYFNLEGMPQPAAHAADYSNTRELGRLIYTDYVYPFEIAAVILLVAIVAAIALTLRHRKDTKYIDPSEQLKVRRQDRVRMVSMPSEKRAGEEAK
jgi:NADH-quinone oxidoreductase subunit J